MNDTDNLDSMDSNGYKNFIKRKAEIESKKIKIIEALKELKSLNDSETISKIFASVLISEHRTNQQLIIKNIFNALKIYAENAGTDDRNKSSVEWAKSATEKETYFPYI